MDDDSFTLNIQMPVRKPGGSAPVSQTADRRQNRKFDRMQQRESSRGGGSGGFQRNNQRRFGNQEDGDRSHSRGDRLMDNSRKIKKQPKNKREPTKKYDLNANVEEVLAVDEKKNEETHIFAGETFEEIPDLNPKLLSALHENKYVTLTKIQKESIPTVMKNKNCIIKSETGSGKTLAYLTPIVNQMSLREEKMKREDGTFCIVICPTRELCVQVVETTKLLLKCAVNIVCGAIMGGESIKKEKARLRKGTNILVCTPGRLVYHMQNTASFNYEPLKYLVFEESDRTLDMGFKKELEEIISIVNSRKDYEKIQKILISANFTDKIQALSLKIAPKDCVHLGFQPKNKMEEEDEEAKTNEQANGDETYQTPSRLNQKFVVVDEGRRITFLLSILVASEKSKAMIFVATCDEVEALEMIFEQATFNPPEGEGEAQRLIPGKIFKLHGKIDQKIRTKTYLDFKKASEGILLCTDVASRGLDFDDVKLIVQLDPPETITDYVNRMGRTARIGNYGMSLLFLTGTELGYVKLLKEKGISIEEYPKENYDAFIQAKLQHELTDENSDPYNYLGFRIRQIMRDDVRHKIKARKAYISYVRAYARQKEKDIFHPKKLNLERLAKSFGLVTSKTVKSELDSEGFLPRTLFKEKRKFGRGLSTKALEIVSEHYEW